MADKIEIAKRSGRTLSCPKCHGHLTVVLSDHNEVDICPEECGTWVDIWEEKALWNFKPEVFTVDELLQFRKYYEGIGSLEPLRYISCPVCNELMNRKVWGSYSGVIIDRCQAHGTWYDKGEIEKIREYIAKGGVEFEKLCRSDSGISDLNLRMSQLETRLDKKINGAYMRARFYNMIGF